MQVIVYKNVLEEYNINNGAVRVLILKPLGAGFALLFIGLMIATFVFFYEIKCGYENNSN